MRVTEVIPEFADAFGFDEFNRMQREALPALLDSDMNVVASAPTAAGKTALAELAICRTLRADGTALFIAPMRALTTEKEQEWERFEELGYSVYVVTGERDLSSRRAERADILVMTPEKLDSATRKHDSPRYAFITDIDCCVIDEVHLLDSTRRGSVLEVTVSRLRRLCDPRIIAISATIPNIQDVAEWLDAPADGTFSFNDSYRPVELRTGVKTYQHGENTFADRYRRLYRALDVAEEHLRDGGQALVFVASRRDTVQATRKARDELAERDVPIGARGDYDLHTAANDLANDTLRKSVPDGVAFHHAGLARDDRNRVEEWFRDGTIELLFSTSTLAWGVNLPARCVIIRDTSYHDPLEGDTDISPLDIIQMLGRAGRPGYDDVGYGWVICDQASASKYRRLLREGPEIESRLGDNLEVHLNAEIALGTITDLDDVMDWLDTTFYAVRSRSAPQAYGAEGLRDRMRSTLERLIHRGFVETDADLGISATTLGKLTSDYYLRLGTAERFRDLAAVDDIDAERILEAVAGADEFDSVTARADEVDAIEEVLTNASSAAEPDGSSGGREPSPGHRKVLAVLRASMADDIPPALRSDAWVIRQNALRLLAACGAFLNEFATPRASNLAKRVEARVDHGVPADAVGLTDIEGIGPERARQLAAAGLTTPRAVRSAEVSTLTDAGLSQGVADRLRNRAGDSPQLRIEWGEFPTRIRVGENTLEEVSVRNAGAGANVGVRVTVNEVEMHTKSCYLETETTVPVGVFGPPDERTVTYEIEVVCPDRPLLPVRSERTVRVESESDT